ncbi:MAG: hypothetical protein CYPHOPRED_003090 [Cyphobasidiales sp. Tagirdzhanova-0007]|nr:MAG: hypothetical protein CYPHOPRED_003090 [Cyphobasidiales sp. Tagirdzhanova-0007]
MRPLCVHALLLLLAATFLLVRALEDVPLPMQLLPTDASENQGPPKLFRPKKGMHKEEHEVDPGNQRARADNEILENAEDNQPEGERVADSLDDLSADDLLAMLHSAYGHDEL